MHQFDYVAARSVEEALEVKDCWREKAAILSGGTSLLVDVRAHKARPDLLIDISGLEELGYIRETDGHIRIGPLVTVAALLESALVKAKAPVLALAARRFANPLVRNRATVGGNLAYASPAADMAVPLLASAASVELARKGHGHRRVPLEEFFVGPRQTTLEPDEMITGISFRAAGEGTRCAYIKLGCRNATAISVVSVAVVLALEGDRCHDAWIALGAVAPTPIRVSEAEALLRGQHLSPALREACGRAAVAATRPIGDIRASTEYRRDATDVLVQRALAQALAA